jgi:hypothetical protein
LKCRYSYCKHNNEVSKEDAVKEGSSYYHKDCLEEKTIKQQIEEYYINNMPSCTLQILRKVIKQLIHEKNNSANYVLFVLEFIHKNNKPINNPFGLTNYCNEGRLKTEFKNKEISIKYKEVKKDCDNKLNIQEINFNYKPTTKKWTDLI